MPKKIDGDESGSIGNLFLRAEVCDRFKGMDSLNREMVEDWR